MLLWTAPPSGTSTFFSIMIQFRKLNAVSQEVQQCCCFFCLFFLAENQVGGGRRLRPPDGWRGGGGAGCCGQWCVRTRRQGWPIILCIFCSRVAGIYFVRVSAPVGLPVPQAVVSELRFLFFIFISETFHERRGQGFGRHHFPLCTVFFYWTKWLISARGGHCIWFAGKMLIFYCTFNLLIRINDYYDDEPRVSFLPCDCNVSPSSDRESKYATDRQ